MGDDRSEPNGLRLVCGIMVVLGMSSGVGGLSAIAAGAALGPAAGGGIDTIGALGLLTGGGYLAAAYGLWTGTDWAWQGTIGVLAGGTLVHLVNPGGPGVALFAASASAGLCAYLLTDGERFRPARRRVPANATT